MFCTPPEVSVNNIQICSHLRDAAVFSEINHFMNSCDINPSISIDPVRNSLLVKQTAAAGGFISSDVIPSPANTELRCYEEPSQQTLTLWRNGKQISHSISSSQSCWFTDNKSSFLCLFSRSSRIITCGWKSPLSSDLLPAGQIYFMPN